MKIRRNSAAWLSWIWLMPAGAMAGEAAATRYVSVDGVNQIVIEAGEMHAVPVIERPVRQGFTWGAPVIDCSDAVAACVQAERLTFAVLKGQAHPGDTYSVKGLRFTVTGCDDALCATQDIAGDCEEWTVPDGTDEGVCQPLPAGAARKESDIRLTYRYVAGRGIVSLAVTFAGVPLTDANRYVLAEGRALLAP